jgi:pectate lyase
MANLSIINGYRLLPLAAGLNYSMVSDATTPPTVLGWPMYENGSMDGTLTGSAADYTVVSGDFSQYCIVDRVGTSIEVVQNVFGTNHRPTGQRGFYMHFRVGADWPDPRRVPPDQPLGLMATARKVVATQTFVAITEEDGYRVVVEGEELDATDELVKANPDHFEPKK